MDFTEIRRRTIVALFSDDVLFDELVLKGGNAISLIYGHGHRASLDLDFSIADDFKDPVYIERRIFAALDARFNEVGFMIGPGQLRRFVIDLSKYEHVADKVESDGVQKAAVP
jgi:nucleotidyltransferase AbiEii toxin of type IV toxin-antitoxin system